MKALIAIPLIASAIACTPAQAHDMSSGTAAVIGGIIGYTMGRSGAPYYGGGYPPVAYPPVAYPPAVPAPPVVVLPPPTVVQPTMPVPPGYRYNYVYDYSCNCYRPVIVSGY